MQHILLIAHSQITKIHLATTGHTNTLRRCFTGFERCLVNSGSFNYQTASYSIFYLYVCIWAYLQCMYLHISMLTTVELYLFLYVLMDLMVKFLSSRTVYCSLFDMSYSAYVVRHKTWGMFVFLYVHLYLYNHICLECGTQ